MEPIVRSIKISTGNQRPPPSNEEGPGDSREGSSIERSQPHDATEASGEGGRPFETLLTERTVEHLVERASPGPGKPTSFRTPPKEGLETSTSAVSVGSPVISDREIAASVLASADKRRAQRPSPQERRAFESEVMLRMASSACTSASPPITSEGLLESLAVHPNKLNRGGEPAMERCSDPSPPFLNSCSDGSAGQETAKDPRVSSPSPTDFQLQSSLQVSADKRHALFSQGLLSQSPSRGTPYEGLGSASPLPLSVSGGALSTQLVASTVKTPQSSSPTAIPLHALEESTGAYQPEVPSVEPTRDAQLSAAASGIGSTAEVRKEDEDGGESQKWNTNQDQGGFMVANSTWNSSTRDPFLDYAYLEERLQANKNYCESDENATSKGKTPHALEANSARCEEDNAVVEKNDPALLVNSKTQENSPSEELPQGLPFLPPQFYQLEKDIKAISEGRLCSVTLSMSPIPPSKRTREAPQVGRGSIVIPYTKREAAMGVSPCPTAGDESAAKPLRRSSLILAEGGPYLSCYTPLQEPHRPLSMPCRSTSPPPIQIPRTLAPPPPLPRPPSAADLDHPIPQTLPGSTFALAEKEAPAPMVESPTPVPPCILPDSKRTPAPLSHLPRPVPLSSQIHRQPLYPNSPIRGVGRHAPHSRLPFSEGNQTAVEVPPARAQATPLPFSLSPREGRSTPYPRGSIILTVNSPEDDTESEIISRTSGDATNHTTPSGVKLEAGIRSPVLLVSPERASPVNTPQVSDDVPAQAPLSSSKGSPQLQSDHPSQHVDPIPHDTSSSFATPQSRQQNRPSGEVSGTTGSQSTPKRPTQHSGRLSQVDRLMKMLPDDAVAAIETSVSKCSTAKSSGKKSSKSTGVQDTPSSSDMQIPSHVAEASNVSDSIAQRIAQNPRKKTENYSYDSYLIYLSQLNRTSAKKIRKKAGKRMQKRIERDVLEDKANDKNKAAALAEEGGVAKRMKAETTKTPPTRVPLRKKTESKEEEPVVVSPLTPSINSQPQSHKLNAASHTSGERRETAKKGGTPNKPTRRLFASPSSPPSRVSLPENEERTPLKSSVGSESTKLRGRPKRRKTDTGVASTSPVKEPHPSSPKPVSPKDEISPTQKRSPKQTLVADDKEKQNSAHPNGLHPRKKKRHRKRVSRPSNE
ncbi:unnamed protein product [Phytomonas sp. EM1]|nr:unnamed protein product [Phytomonas sp. EM1]|eukprot:CCW62777.1 unnamed protein product [Phytomonas sp. isolate EM1]